MRRGKEKDFRDVIDVWKKIIDVQQHFNEIELKIRNLFITVMAAIISAVALVLERGQARLIRTTFICSNAIPAISSSCR